MKRLVRATIVLAFLAAMSLIALPKAGAYHRWVNHHWARTANPLTLTYSANVSGPWGGLVDKVIGEWDNVTQYQAGTFDVFNFTPVASAAKMSIESNNYGATGWFGEAEITRNILTGHIEKGTVRVNDYYFTGQFNTTAARDHVLCQEVGHILGLDHNKLSPLFGASCMEDDNGTLNDPAYQTPNYHDAQQLNSIYKHFDSGLGAILGSIPLGIEIVDIVPA